MAIKNQELVALPDKWKAALRLFARFDIEWDGVVITKGVDAIKALQAQEQTLEHQYWNQNAPLTVLSIAEKNELERMQRKDADTTARELRLKQKEFTTNKANILNKTQVSLF